MSTTDDQHGRISCRHCGNCLRRLKNGYWVDGDGMYACVKAPLESAGSGRPAGFVLHEPMPAGLRGAATP
jgi:hypothetical protein